MASCFCIRLGKETVRTLDFRHCNLRFVPEEIVEFEETLEELYLDSNDIRDLPRDLFHCQLLKKLGVSDNELVTIPNIVANLIVLEELDISKNGIVELPDSIKSCKSLSLVEVSVNPLGKLPEGFTQLMNLTQLYLNDTLLDYLPANFGRLTRLRVLELRENRLKALPKSISRLSDLERLDLGQNSFREIPDVIGSLTKLTEVWIDTNKVTHLPRSFGNLTALIYFDASCNRLEYLPSEMDNLECLTDLHLSKNFLLQLPDNIGNLRHLTTLKADNNQLASLPHSVGGLVSLEELILSANDLEDLPHSIGLLRRLRHLNVDENMLQRVPAELGSCSSITLLSLRGNYLQTLPDEIGRITNLAVVNLSNNRLQCLPYSFTKLKNLQALWLSENQSKPLLPLQSEFVDQIGTRVLTCFLFPQQPQEYDEDSNLSDGESFHQSVYEQQRARRMKIAFDVAESEAEQHVGTARATTPYPKETIRPRFRMGTSSPRIPNGHLPSRRPNLADKVNSPQMELLPSKPAVDTRSPRRVRGRRELQLDGIRIREAKVTRPRSPGSTIGDSLHLFQADKEKKARDKARLRRTPSAESVAEAATPRSGKGFFKRSKSDRGAHSDTEVINADWTPRKSSMRWSLNVDRTREQNGHAPFKVKGIQVTDGPGQSEMRKTKSRMHHNGGTMNSRRSGGEFGTRVIQRSGSDDRLLGGKGYDSDYVDGRRTHSQEDFRTGVRRHSGGGPIHPEQKPRRRSSDRSMNATTRRGGASSLGEAAYAEKRRSHHRRTGYGTDPELEELHHSSSDDRISRKRQQHLHQTPVKNSYSTDSDGRTPKSSHSNHSSNEHLSNPHSGYGTDSEIMAYNGPFDYSSSQEDLSRSSRGAQRSLERQNTLPLKQDSHKDFREGERYDGDSGQKEEWLMVDEEGCVEDGVQWAIPTFKAGNTQEKEEKRGELHQEPKPDYHMHHISDQPKELGHIAVFNASVQRADGQAKEGESAGTLSRDETDCQQGLHWDISEILGSSSRTVGQMSTESTVHSSQTKTTDIKYQAENDIKVAEGKGSKTFKSSTPEDVRQRGKSRISAREIENEMEGIVNGMENVDLKNSGDVEEKPQPAYPLRADPNSPLPPSPVQRVHVDSPTPGFIHKHTASPSTLPQYHQRQQTDSPVPTQHEMIVPSDSTPGSKMNLRHPVGNPHSVERPTTGDHARPIPNRGTPAQGQGSRRGPIPSYKEALRRRENLVKEQSPSVNALPLYGSRQHVKPLEPAPVFSENFMASKRREESKMREEHQTTQAKNLNRTHCDGASLPVTYETVNKQRYDPPVTENYEMQGQPHDRESCGVQQNVYGKVTLERQDPPSHHPTTQGDMKSIPWSNHERLDGGDYSPDDAVNQVRRPQAQGDGGYHQMDAHPSRDSDDVQQRPEADMKRNVARGQSPFPIHATQRRPLYKDGYESISPDNDGGQTHTLYLRQEGADRDRQRNRWNHEQRDATNDELQRPHRDHAEDQGFVHPRLGLAPPYKDHALRMGSRDRTEDKTHAQLLNEEHWRQHILTRIAKKNADTQQKATSRPPQGHSHQFAKPDPAGGAQSTKPRYRPPAPTTPPPPPPPHNSHAGPQGHWQEEQRRRGLPPNYHRDWSPATHTKPSPQVMDQVDMKELRRGTPPGSSGSSTTGGNGRSFPPSPSLQRRMYPCQAPIAHSPLPARRADPDGFGGPKRIPVVIYKNPGLGFSITGGLNSQGNPFHPDDMGIFVTKVQPDGPADHLLVPGDKLLEVNDRDFVGIDHETAVTLLKNTNPVSMVISRET